MYYILNETNQIIAADENLLDLCGFTHINELNTDIILKKITFSLVTDNMLTITTPKSILHLSIHKIPLSTLLGQLTLMNVEDEAKTTSDLTIEDDTDINRLIIRQDEKEDNLLEIDDFEVVQQEKIDLDTHIPNIDSLYNTSTNVSSKEKIAPFVSTPKDSITIQKEEIFIDVKQISEEIGVSEEDFNAFLNEYISTALDLEKDLQSDDPSIRLDTINTLSHLSEVLHLDTIGDIIEKIKKSSQENRIHYVTAFYNALSLITTIDSNNSEDLLLYDKPQSDIDSEFTPSIERKINIDTDALDFNVETTSKPETEETKNNISIKEENIDLDIENISTLQSSNKDIVNRPTEDLFELNLDDTPIIIPKDTSKETLQEEDSINLNTPSMLEETQSEEEKSLKTVDIPQKQNGKHFGLLDLSKVTPIHFDFSIHAAADELSLPESLIEEFMIDFVEQAHTETDNMLKAYKKGDLASIQKIGHLLKGVSSNLRITTLSDTLYKIQFCDNPDNLENLIKDYWGHFLAFEKQINLLSSKEK